MMHRGLAAMLGALLVLASLEPAAAAGKRDLDLKAPDGAHLKATFYPAAGPGPGMLLLHQCNMDRGSWDPLAVALTRKGIHVLTFDYRGYGESDGKRADTLTPEELRAASMLWPADVDAALAALLAQPGVDGDRIAAGGASCGVHQSIQLARRSGRVKALVLLSGGTKALDEGAAYLASVAQMPIFGAASTEDGDAVATMRRIVGLSKNPGSVFKECHDAGHGVPMFARETALLPGIVDWVDAALVPRRNTARTGS